MLLLHRSITIILFALSFAAGQGDDESTTTTEESSSSQCVFDDGISIRFFDPLRLECPAVGERLVISLSFLFPSISSNINNGMNTTATTELSVAASHGQDFARTDGIAVALIRKPDNDNSNNNDAHCRALPATPEDSAAFLGMPSQDDCIFELYASNTLCRTERVEAEPAKEFAWTVLLWNTGGCTSGQYTLIEAALRDSDSPENNITLSSGCGDPLMLSNECGDANGTTTPSPPVSPTMAPFRVPATTPGEQPDDDDDNSSCAQDDGIVRSFSPFELECPLVGEFVTAPFSFISPAFETLPVFGSVRISAAAAYGENFDSIEGIAMALWGWNDNCDLLPSSLEFVSRFGLPSNPNCDGELNSPSKLCDSITPLVGNASTTEEAVLVWNTGGCDGRIRIEVNLMDLVTDSLLSPSKCKAPLTDVNCDGNVSSAVPTSNAPSLAITATPTVSPSQSPTFFECVNVNGEIRTFPSLVVACPPVDDFVVVGFSFTTAVFEIEPLFGATTQVSAAVAYGDNFTETDGIEMLLWEQGESCDLLPTSLESVSMLGTVSNAECNGDLNADAKRCDGITPTSTSGAEYDSVVLIWNTGGCRGDIRVEVNLRDLESGSSVVSAPSECLSPLTPVECKDITATTTSPTLLNTTSPTKAPHMEGIPTSTPAIDMAPTTTAPSIVASATDAPRETGLPAIMQSLAPTMIPSKVPGDTTGRPVADFDDEPVGTSGRNRLCSGALSSLLVSSVVAITLPWT